MNKQSPASISISKEKLEGFVTALVENGFIETLSSKNAQGVVILREFRAHDHLRNAQASLNRRNPDLIKAPVVSIYESKSPRVVASPAAVDMVTSIVAGLTPSPDL